MRPRKQSAPACLIVDEHPVVRQGVRALLERTWPDASVSDAKNLEAAVGTNGEVDVDVVVIDP